jgi:hypothetical protein
MNGFVFKTFEVREAPLSFVRTNVLPFSFSWYRDAVYESAAATSPTVHPSE